MVTIAAVFLSAHVLAGAGEPVPGEILKLGRWKLTLPAETDRPGDPDEIEPAQLQTFVDGRYFHVCADGRSIVFRAPCGGATTKGSRYPRCELREMSDDGKTDAAWGTNERGRRELNVRLAITKVPPKKPHVVCTQIHDAKDDLLMIRLEGRRLFIERNDEPEVLLDAAYELGTRFDLRIAAGDGVVEVRYNGEPALRWDVARKGCYFKVGCYTQSNPDRGDAPDATGEVVVERLSVTVTK